MSGKVARAGKVAKKAPKVVAKVSPVEEEAPLSPPQSPAFSPMSSPESTQSAPDEKVPSAKGDVGRFVHPVRFELEEVFTFGVDFGKFGGYSIPIKFDPAHPQTALIRDVAERNGALLKLYGEDESTLYLRCDKLTEKQVEDLLGKKAMIVKVEFEVNGTYKAKDGKTALRIKVNGLAKVRVAERILDDAPADLVV